MLLGLQAQEMEGFPTPPFLLSSLRFPLVAQPITHRLKLEGGKG